MAGSPGGSSLFATSIATSLLFTIPVSCYFSFFETKCWPAISIRLHFYDVKKPHSGSHSLCILSHSIFIKSIASPVDSITWPCSKTLLLTPDQLSIKLLNGCKSSISGLYTSYELPPDDQGNRPLAYTAQSHNVYHKGQFIISSECIMFYFLSLRCAS